VDFSATELHRCSSGLLLRKVSAEERILETDKEYFPIPGLGILLYAAVRNIQSIREHRNPIHSLYVLMPIGASRQGIKKLFEKLFLVKSNQPAENYFQSNQIVFEVKF
jgi:hypothetical protein